jgi:hypothetical protein
MHIAGTYSLSIDVVPALGTILIPVTVVVAMIDQINQHLSGPAPDHVGRRSPVASPLMAATTQAGPIALYGATGFTGRLVARELRRRGADILVAGRGRDKLEALSADLGGVPIAVASVDDPGALRSLLGPCAAVVACAGPFPLHGEPVLAAAADTGTHYLDTTGE